MTVFTKPQIDCVESAIRSLRYGAHPHRSPHADDLEAMLASSAAAQESAEKDVESIVDNLASAKAVAIQVLVERARQISVEGWTPEHDDEHDCGELAEAAACYASSSTIIEKEAKHVPAAWPWDESWWRPGDRRRMLVKAGALILAEIERLDRADQAAL